MVKPKTRERILDAALELFNREGLDVVSTRQIAQQLGISQGNLCYHFPHKDQLVLALYQRLAADFDAMFATMQTANLDFRSLLLGSYAMFGIQYRYKFLMLNFVQVMRQYPEIRSHFQALFQARRQQFDGFFRVLARKGWLKSELAPAQLEQLIELQFITGNFWMADAEIIYQGPESDKVLHYTRLITSMIRPYLTETGCQAFDIGWQALDELKAGQ